MIGTIGMQVRPAPPCVAGSSFTAFHHAQHRRRGLILARAAQVLLTREKGKNTELRDRLYQDGVEVVEIPLIETERGPDKTRLQQELAEKTFSWVTITSPEAASVFLDSWNLAGQPDVQIATVGKATSRILQNHMPPCEVQFEPSQADGAHLAAELPDARSKTKKEKVILWPTSVKAGSDLQDGLEERGYKVVRLNTYNTVTVKDLSPSSEKAARSAGVVALASPSTLKAWVEIVGKEHAAATSVACIGGTTAKAAEELGLTKVFKPESPGLEGLTKSIHEALKAMETDRQDVKAG